MLDDTLEKLKTIKAEEKSSCNTIDGVPNYDIMMNPEYIMAFQYIPAYSKMRNILIQDDDRNEKDDYKTNDVPRLALNLAMYSHNANTKSNFLKSKFNLDSEVAKSTQIN